jgi:Sulfocyanin (SoxE) domain
MQRYLVAINYDGPHDRLTAEVRALALAGDAQFHIVVPAVSHAGVHSEGQEQAVAQQRLDSITSALEDLPGVDGNVGDANLFGAIGDELDRSAYDVLAIVTPPIGEHEQERLVDQLVRLYRLPVIPVSATAGEWLQRRPSQFGLEIDQGTPHRGAVTIAPVRRRTSGRTFAFLAVACCVLLATTVGAIAWGASQSGAAVAPFPSVTAIESDFAIHLSASHVAAGPFALVAENRGPSAHELVVFRTTLAPNKLPLGPNGNVIESSPQLVKVADSGASVLPGQSRTLYTVLTPGNYVFVCNLPGHYRLGMRAALVVQ